MLKSKSLEQIRLDSDLRLDSYAGNWVREVLRGDPTHRYDNVSVANSALFLLRQMQFVRSEIRQVEYPEHKLLTFVPLATDILGSISQYVYFVRDRTGKARIMNANAKSPMPRFDITTAERYGRVVSLEGCYGWSIDELREAARLSMDLPSMKAENSRDILLRDTDEVLRTGQLVQLTGEVQTASDIGGFLNHAEIAQSGVAITYTDEAGATQTNTFGSLFGNWFVSSTTPDSIVKDLVGAETTIVNATLGTNAPDTLLVPQAVLNLLMSTKMSQASDKTVLRYYLDNSPNIKQIEPWIYLNNAGAAEEGQSNKHRLIMYKRDKRVLEAVNPIEYEQQPAQIEGFEFTIPCRAKVGGVKVYNPRACLYCDVSVRTS